jgi:hypothetical protein
MRSSGLIMRPLSLCRFSAEQEAGVEQLAGTGF